jgi:hypothetical protein
VYDFRRETFEIPYKYTLMNSSLLTFPLVYADSGIHLLLTEMTLSKELS